MGKNVIIFGADLSLSVHIDNKKKDTLILGKGQTEELDDTMLSAEADIQLIFQDHTKKSCLSLHCNASNSFLFVNATKVYLFKANDSEIKKYSLYLGNVSKDFPSLIMKKTRIKWICLQIFC